jgi:Flp pilus assembly protein CpaB
LFAGFLSLHAVPVLLSGSFSFKTEVKMRRFRTILFLLLIVVIGGAVVLMFMQRFLTPEETPEVASNEPAPTPVVQTVDVAVVTQRVQRGQVLDESVLGLVPYQRDLVIEGWYTNIGAVSGQRARVDLEPGYVLHQSMLSESSGELSSTGSDAALMIPRGMVAVSIPISRLSSISYAPQRGDHVNVIVTMLLMQLDEEFQTQLPNLSAAVIPPGNTLMAGPFDPQAESVNGTIQTNELLQVANTQSLPGSGPIGRAVFDAGLEQTFYVVPSEAQRPRLVSQTLLQDAIVLQVGTFVAAEAQQPAAQSQAQLASAETETAQSGNQQADQNSVPNTPKPPDVITLVVTPQDAVTLNYLMFSGAELTLALRGVGDDSRVQTEAATLQFLLENYSIPVPVKLPYGMEPRVDELNSPVLINDALPEPAP